MHVTGMTLSEYQMTGPKLFLTRILGKHPSHQYIPEIYMLNNAEDDANLLPSISCSFLPQRDNTTVIIAWQSLPSETLNNLIEYFVLREGTDYGEEEHSLAEKVIDVKRSLREGESLLVWSELHKTVNILPRSQLNQSAL